MAEINANSLPAKTDLGTNDSAIVVDQTTNAGALVDLDVLADKVLDRISSKTYANQVGGSSAATLLAQLSTLNSNIMTGASQIFGNITVEKIGRWCVVRSIGNTVRDDGKTIGQITGEYRPVCQVNVSSYVYAGSEAGYVPCRIMITTAGYMTITSFSNLAIENVQPSFFQHMPIVYYALA